MPTECVGRKGLKKLGDLPEGSQLRHSGSNSGVERPVYVVVKSLASGTRLKYVTPCVFVILPGLSSLVGIIGVVDDMAESPASRLQADRIPPCSR